MIETNVVIPTLVRCLQRFESPSLQIEAAWSLTNVACGEARHIACLVECGAIPELVRVVALTANATLRDQALWALCNMSSDEAACLQMARLPDVLVPLLKQVGLAVAPYHEAEQAPGGGPQGWWGVSQFDMGEIPSLSTMRHVAFICGNFARYEPQHTTI